MNAAEAKQEFEKLAREHGLGDDQVKAVLQAFENEKFAGAVANGYTRHSEYSRSLDKLKDAEGKLKATEEWYNTQAAPVFKQTTTALETLAKYEALYGKLDDQSSGNRNAAAAAAGITREELEAMLKQRENAVLASVVDYERQMGDMRLGHYQKFNEVLPVKELEKFMREHQITDLERGYELFVKPRVQQVEKDADEKKWATRKEEWEKDFRSRYKLAPEPKAAPTTVFEDLDNARRSKYYNEHDADAKARSAFLDSMKEDWSSQNARQ